MTRAALTRPAVEDPNKLQAELTEIQELFHEMEVQGHAADKSVRYSILDDAIHKLLKKPELNLILSSPVFKVQIESPEDPDALLDTLIESAANTLLDPTFQNKGGGVRTWLSSTFQEERGLQEGSA